MAISEEEPRVLFTHHVAALFSELAGRTIPLTTVSSYHRKSQPGGRFHRAGRPMPPAQRDGRRLYWFPEQKPDLIAWWTAGQHWGPTGR